jgi:hypothetical protein
MLRCALIISTAFLLLLNTCPAHSAENNAFITSYECFDIEGNERWKAQAEITKTPQKDIFILEERGEGRFSGFAGEVSWVSSLEFESTKTDVKPLKMEKTVYSRDGKKLATETQKFVFQESGNKVSVKLKDIARGRETNKKFRFRGNIVNRLLLGLYIQKLIDNGKTEKTVHLISSEPQLYKVNIELLDTENVSIHGKKRKAYKFCLDPEIGLLNFVKVFLPKAYVWHSATPEYEWMMYKGVESTLSSPRVEIVTLD